MATIREILWPIAGKNLAKLTVRPCVVCCRYNARSCSSMMGDLPKPRITPAMSFETTFVPRMVDLDIEACSEPSPRSSKVRGGLILRPHHNVGR
ncbi:hypothetical protein NQ317_016070 [Molorchus minor]|uniref:Uncharacterized protein n=1 Tax=Molorchus minor TaxID=1323400 RepID=A0ABQ9IQU5_9CUCU|nr:hypothetical protein NQ317_016070 [Molorchus minor]